MLNLPAYDDKNFTSTYVQERGRSRYRARAGTHLTPQSEDKFLPHHALPLEVISGMGPNPELELYQMRAHEAAFCATPRLHPANTTATRPGNPLLLAPMSHSSRSGFSQRVDSWVKAQSTDNVGPLEDSVNPQLPIGASDSDHEGHRPLLKAPPPSSPHIQTDLPAKPPDKVDTPTELNSPDYLPDATYIHDLLKRIPASQMGELFSDKLTLQVSLGDMLARWVHGTDLAHAVKVTTTNSLSSHPTTDTLGSQRNNPFLRSMSSLLAAELAFKYPDPQAALRDMDKAEGLMWLRPVEPVPLPSASEQGGGPSSPPSYRDPVAGSGIQRKVSLPNVDIPDTGRMPSPKRTEQVTNEFMAAMRLFVDEEVAATIRALSTFNIEDHPTHNIESLKTARTGALSSLGSSLRSIMAAMSDIHPDAWDLHSPEWKHKWESNMEALTGSMRAIRKYFRPPLELDLESKKNRVRYIRHLTTRLEDEVDEVEARVESFKRLFLTLQAKYLANKLKEVKDALKKSRFEATKG